MKSEWTYRPLGELVSFASGGTPSKKRDDYWGGTIPWISAKTLKTENIDTSDLFITEEGLKAGSKIAPKGSILLLTRGSGLFNGIPIARVEKDVAFNQDIKCLDSYGEVENEFIFYWLLSQKDYLMAKVGVTGIGAGKFDLDFLQKLMIPIPSERERKSIVGFASSISEKIRCNAKVNDNLQQQAMALYAEMFLNSSDSNVTSGTLSDIAVITMGQSPSGSSYNEDGVGEVFYQGRAEFGFRFPKRRLFTTEPKRMAETGDVLLSVRAPVGDLNMAYERCCIGRGLGAIHSKTGHSSFVLYTMFALRSQLNVFNGEGTVFGSINRDALNAIPIDIPPVTEIDQFEVVAHPIDELIRANYEENCRLEAIRDSLLPKLMSGEIDVSAVQL